MGIQIGCGSWTDPEYTGILYPPGLPANQRLHDYARSFGHVEVNASFYAITPRSTAAKWAEQTPPGFFFDFKLHKTLSRHATKMGDLPVPLRIPGIPPGQNFKLTPALQADLVAYTLQGLQPLVLQKKLGAFLLLLTPRFQPGHDHLEELDPLIHALKDHPLAVELRHRAWIEGPELPRTLAYFRERGVTLVNVDMPDSIAPNVMPPLDEITNSRLGYLRLHGRNEHGYLHGKSASERFHYDYSAAELKEIAVRIGRLAAKTENLRVIASNHAEDFAPRAALALKRLLGQPMPAPIAAQKELFL